VEGVAVPAQKSQGYREGWYLLAAACCYCVRMAACIWRALIFKRWASVWRVWC
jgi:hypothetical protein